MQTKFEILMRLTNVLLILAVGLFAGSCGQASSGEEAGTGQSGKKSSGETTIDQRLEKYVPVRLTADLEGLSDQQKELVRTLIEAGKIMDELFWVEAYGDKEALMERLPDDRFRRFAKINYGPWDRLAGNEPFVEGIGPKPAGANFYPADMSKEEFEAAELPDKASLYTFLRRDDEGDLMTVPYHEMFAEEVRQASGLLKKAAGLTENDAFRRYLEMRAQALLDDQYQASDFAWMDMKDNPIDLVYGPIETYEDQLFGYKAAHECYVLIKDMEWSERLARYAKFLPDLQSGLPVPAKYKQEKPGREAQLNAYDVVFYAGDCNAGSKTIAINLPNDEAVQLEKGTRRLQLKNAMRAKFDQILVPISETLIAKDQRRHITFNAFFSNTMFHEVAHGLGIKKVVGKDRTVREALKEHASALEEGKADILGLYMIRQLHADGELKADLMDYYVTFMASIFRSVRFGASSAHGKANMIRFNYFLENGALEFNADKETYRVNPEKLEAATASLSEKILTLQGDGDYEGVAELVRSKGLIKSQLQKDLERLNEAGIPVDIVFEQGVEVLNL